MKKFIIVFITFITFFVSCKNTTNETTQRKSCEWFMETNNEIIALEQYITGSRTQIEEISSTSDQKILAPLYRQMVSKLEQREILVKSLNKEINLFNNRAVNCNGNSIPIRELNF